MTISLTTRKYTFQIQLWKVCLPYWLLNSWRWLLQEDFNAGLIWSPIKSYKFAPFGKDESAVKFVVYLKIASGQSVGL